jgi:hypothetical protein
MIPSHAQKGNETATPFVRGLITGADEHGDCE